MALKEQPTKVSLFNLSDQNLDRNEISLFSLSDNFVPVTKTGHEDKKIDVLRFTRKLLLAFHFFNSDFNDGSLVRPNSCFIPKTTSSHVLKQVVEELEMFANTVPNNLEKRHRDDNLTEEQRAAITTFKNRKGVLYFVADKGSSVVILNEEFYRFKVLEILNSPKYEKLTRNVDTFVISKLKILVDKYKHCLTKPERRAITSFDHTTTNIYGVPKIHKSKILKEAIKLVSTNYLMLPNPVDLKFRLIFGGPNSPTVILATLVQILLRLFVCKVKNRVQDVWEFKRKLPKLSKEDLRYIVLISVDVVSMYENLEQNLGIPALQYYLNRYKELLPSRFSVDCIVDFMKFVLDNNTGYFDGEFYRQTTGTATGIKPAPEYADLAMGFLEVNLFYKIKKELGNDVALYFSDNYRRFLDDGFILWDTRLGNFQQVFNIMNNMYPSIKFTMEQSESSLQYLDIEVYKTPEGIKTKAFTKPTDSGTFLPFDSCHPHHCKINIPFNMARRVKALTDDPTIVVEKMQELKIKLHNCGYPIKTINLAIEQASQLNTQELLVKSPKPEQQNSICFVNTFDPFYPTLFGEIKGFFNKLKTNFETKQVFENYKIINSLKNSKNLKGLFQHSKFDFSGNTVSIPRGVTKCGSSRCKTCENITEVDSVTFKNTGVKFNIKTSMNCLARNVVYYIVCKKCSEDYVGETVNLRNRNNSHRNNSKEESRAVMEVSRHIFCCGEGYTICPILKVKQDCKITRLIKEDSIIKMAQPSLNRDTRNLLHLNLWQCQPPAKAAIPPPSPRST